MTCRDDVAEGDDRPGGLSSTLRAHPAPPAPTQASLASALDVAEFLQLFGGACEAPTLDLPAVMSSVRWPLDGEGLGGLYNQLVLVRGVAGPGFVVEIMVCQRMASSEGIQRRRRNGSAAFGRRSSGRALGAACHAMQGPVPWALPSLRHLMNTRRVVLTPLPLPPFPYSAA